MPVRGFGAKNVVFSGMRTPAAAAARIVSTSTGRRSTAACGLTLLDRRRHGRGIVAVAEGDAGHRREHAGFEPCRVDAAQRRGQLGDEVVERRRRHEQRQAVGVDEAERALAPHRGLERGDARRLVGAGVAHRRRPARARPRMRTEPRSCKSRWIARTQSCSGASSTTSVMIAPAPVSSAPRSSR